MQTPSAKLPAIGGPLDGEDVTVEAWVEVVHWWGHVYRVFRDDTGAHFLRYAGLEPVTVA